MFDTPGIDIDQLQYIGRGLVEIGVLTSVTKAIWTNANKINDISLGQVGYDIGRFFVYNAPSITNAGKFFMDQLGALLPNGTPL